MRGWRVLSITWSQLAWSRVCIMCIHWHTQPQLTNTAAAYITSKQILPFEFKAVSAHSRKVWWPFSVSRMRLVEMTFSTNDQPEIYFNLIDISLYQCHMSVVHVEISRDVSDLVVVCLIGQGRLSRPIVCLRCRSTALRIFLPQYWLWR